MGNIWSVAKERLQSIIYVPGILCVKIRLTLELDSTKCESHANLCQDKIICRAAPSLQKESFDIFLFMKER